MIVCIIIGLVVGGITYASLSSQLHSVHQRNEASDYIQKDSFRLSQKKDLFLYKKTERHEHTQSAPPAAPHSAPPHHP